VHQGSVEREDGLGAAVGKASQYHCQHEMGDVRFTLTDWNLPHHFNSDEVAFEVPVHCTTELLPREPGSTLRVLYTEPGTGEKNELEPMFRRASLEALAQAQSNPREPVRALTGLLGSCTDYLGQITTIHSGAWGSQPPKVSARIFDSSHADAH
jgi:hypothetical protein